MIDEPTTDVVHDREGNVWQRSLDGLWLHAPDEALRWESLDLAYGPLVPLAEADPQRPDGVPEWAGKVEKYADRIWQWTDGTDDWNLEDNGFYLVLTRYPNQSHFPGPPDPVPSLIEQAREAAQRLRGTFPELPVAILLDALADELENRDE